MLKKHLHIYIYIYANVPDEQSYLVRYPLSASSTFPDPRTNRKPLPDTACAWAAVKVVAVPSEAAGADVSVFAPASSPLTARIHGSNAAQR